MPLGTGCILVVDDEDEVRSHARIALESRGFTVLTARNSAEALLLADRHSVHIRLLVTDLSMPPYMDGASLALALRGSRPGLPVLFIASRGQAPESCDPGNRPGTVDTALACFLAKPFTPDSLVARVQEMLADPIPPAEPAPDAPAGVLGEPGTRRSILVLVPQRDVRGSVASLLRDEGYRVLEVRNIGEALRVCEWHVGEIGLLLADRTCLASVPGELRERLRQGRPGMRVLTAAIPGSVETALGEKVRHALEGWGVEARGGV